MASQYLARVVEHQSAYIDAFLREELTHLVNRLLEGVVDQVVERVTERLERSERPNVSNVRNTQNVPQPCRQSPPPAKPIW